MKVLSCIFGLSLGLVLLASPAPAQTRRPVSRPAPTGQPVAAPAPLDAPRQVNPGDDRPPLVISKLRLKNPVLVFYQQATPSKVVQQLLMEEKSLGLLKTVPLEELVARREVFLDGLGNYDPPTRSVAVGEAPKYRLTGVSLLVSSEKRQAAPDGRSTYAKLRVPGPGDLYVVRESAEEYRHFVGGPKMSGSRIDFTVNGLPGVDSVRAAYTLRKIDISERGAGSGDVIR